MACRLVGAKPSQAGKLALANASENYQGLFEPMLEYC